tara:strand:+ start:886 stop:1257 length:372 start_codon:yes stop_codon:yes gene_type:complete
MDLTKRKYIDGHIHVRNIYKGSYVVVYNWGVVKLNLNSVSEIVEHDESFFYYTLSKSHNDRREDDIDFSALESFVCFAFGKKLLLTEKMSDINVYNKYMKTNFSKIKIEVITMNNGNSYITIV